MEPKSFPATTNKLFEGGFCFLGTILTCALDLPSPGQLVSELCNFEVQLMMEK